MVGFRNEGTCSKAGFMWRSVSVATEANQPSFELCGMVCLQKRVKGAWPWRPCRCLRRRKWYGSDKEKQVVGQQLERAGLRQVQTDVVPSSEPPSCLGITTWTSILKPSTICASYYGYWDSAKSVSAEGSKMQWPNFVSVRGNIKIETTLSSTASARGHERSFPGLVSRAFWSRVCLYILIRAERG